MSAENITTSINSIHPDLKTVMELVYDACSFDVTDLKLNLESAEYGACSFIINGKKIEHRVSKITPTKTGQFVTIWKRNRLGITQPLDSSDDFDCIMITSKHGDKVGQFIFPKSVLVEKGIITLNGKEGKRGIRVYPPWDITSNAQARKTQAWQKNYFLLLTKNEITDLVVTKKRVESYLFR